MEEGLFHETEIGSPQGGVISPLLANIYLNYLDTVWEKQYSHLGTLVRYADDFVILCKAEVRRFDSYSSAQSGVQEARTEHEQGEVQAGSPWRGQIGIRLSGVPSSADAGVEETRSRRLPAA